MSTQLTVQIILTAQKRTVTANIIAQHTDMHKRSVQRHLAHLNRLGYLEIKKKQDGEIFYKLSEVAL